MAENNVFSTIENLIHVCKDGETGYVHAAGVVKDASLKSWFEEQSRERHRFLQELMEFATKYGDSKPDTSGTVAGTLHRAWFETKADMGLGDDSVIDSVEQGEDAAKDAYQKALSEGLPEDVREVVARQSQSVLAAHNRVRDLRDRRKAA
ncbi:MAG: PA2169 family four-helix-bundle protein [Acidobacteriales bacterium]|nr:PA2169 family four-helix-bundle protein [Terriglobales bacterium]